MCMCMDMDIDMLCGFCCQHNMYMRLRMPCIMPVPCPCLCPCGAERVPIRRSVGPRSQAAAQRHVTGTHTVVGSAYAAARRLDLDAGGGWIGGARQQPVLVHRAGADRRGRRGSRRSEHRVRPQVERARAVATRRSALAPHPFLRANALALLLLAFFRRLLVRAERRAIGRAGRARRRARERRWRR